MQPLGTAVYLEISQKKTPIQKAFTQDKLGKMFYFRAKRWKKIKVSKNGPTWEGLSCCHKSI